MNKLKLTRVNSIDQIKTAKKPKLNHEYNYYYEYDYYSCPSCGRALNYSIRSCCLNNDCRQAIDWEEC